jgi:hypothetical protein
LKDFKHHLAVSTLGDQTTDLRLVNFQSHANRYPFRHCNHGIIRILQIHGCTKLSTGQGLERVVNIATIRRVTTCWGTTTPGHQPTFSATHSAIPSRCTSSATA